MDWSVWLFLSIVVAFVTAFCCGMRWERERWVQWFDESNPYRAYQRMRSEMARPDEEEE